MRPIVPVLLTLLLAACGACGAMPHGFHDPSPADIIRQEDEHAVQITGYMADFGTYMCSGVLVSDHQVVTAAHCADGEAILTVKRSDGTETIFQLEVLIPGSDLARLETVSGWFGDAPSRVNTNTVDLGERVCIAAVVPRRDHKCGEVQKLTSDGFFHSAITEHGNSGGGVYDDDGNLVGIVSTLYTASNGQIIGGGVHSLAGKEWLVRP